MNVHPFIVHFPVALLSIYCLRVRSLTSAPYWFYVKGSFVIIGASGAGAAYKSGEWAKELLGDNGLEQLIETHARWAKLSTLLFGLIAILYIAAWISRSETLRKVEEWMGLNNLWLYTALKKTGNYLVDSFLMILPALIGLAGIVITGALGGAIVYGPDIDPFVRTIYDLLF